MRLELYNCIYTCNAKQHIIKQIVKMLGYSKQNSLTNIFYKIDQSLSKFYSSRPRTIEQSGSCSCKRRNLQKQQQIQFYTSHKQMIGQAAQNLMESNRTSDQVIIGKILTMAVDYINKILELLDMQFLCQCKKDLINQSVITKYKIQFMRQENDKFFKLFEDKNMECENLTSKLREMTNLYEEDVVPLSTRGLNRQGNQKSPVFLPKSANISPEDSARSSKISDICQIGRGEIKNTIQRDHNPYFNIETSKKQRKSKIFNQNH